MVCVLYFFVCGEHLFVWCGVYISCVQVILISCAGGVRLYFLHESNCKKQIYNKKETIYCKKNNAHTQEKSETHHRNK